MELPRALAVGLDKVELRLFDDTNDVQLQSDEPHDVKLQEVLRAFSKPPRLRNLSTILSEYEFSTSAERATASEWFVLARSSTVVMTNLLDELFSRSLPLGQDIMYWDHLLSNRLWRMLYTIQTAPHRLWNFSYALVSKVKSQLLNEPLTLGTLRHSVLDRASFRRIAFPHLEGKNIVSASKMLSIDAMIRQEIRKKMEVLSGLRDAQAQAIGLLVAKSAIGHPDTLARDVGYLTQLLETALAHSSRPYVAAQNDQFAEPPALTTSSPQEVADKLILLSKDFSHRRASFVVQIERNRRPSKLSRYWLLAFAFYAGGSQAFSYFNTREDQIKLWLHDLRRTLSSFWANWIVEPTAKILATIRHDKGSEVALLSSRSLSADLESLERMVVEFAQDNPQYSAATSLEALKDSARNGDLTPVLVAYESNIKSPLRSALTGSLVRALLIQIQKTKVDVEVAINGIDKLLKSQELVFGFVGVSPALALVWIALTWVPTIVGRKDRQSSGQLRLNNMKTLRNIDRLVSATKDLDSLTYKKRGLVLCEAQLLKTYAGCIVSDLRDQYLQDVSDLGQADNLYEVRSILRRIFQVYAGSLSYP